MNFEQDGEPFSQDDMLFGMEGGLDSFNCNSPMGDAAYNDPSRFDHMADAIGDDLGGMQYDNSLAVPMDDYQFPNDMQGGDSRDFQTLQPPVSSAYDMDMGQSQSSMGMGGYSNGGTNEGLLYEQTTAITNGDHHMMGAEEHYGMPGTSFGSYQPSPMEADHHSSPSVSRQHSRPASRTPAQKAPGLVQQLNAPSTSSYSNSPTPTLPPPPVKSAPAKKAPPRPANGSRKKHPQSQNTVGAVLTKANKLAATPAASTSTSLRLSPEEAMRVAALTQEIEQLQQVNTPHSRARQQSLSDERAQIFFNALASQNVSTVASQAAPPPTRPRVSHKKQQPQQPPPPVVVATSPTYTPQCATVYTPADGYAAVPGPSHTGYTVTPSTSQPMQQRGTVYKVNSAPGPQLQQQQHHGGPLRLGPGGPGSAGGPPPPQAIYVQQQLQPLHGQPPPQMVMTSSTPSSLSSMPLTTTPVIVPGRGKGGGRTMMVKQQQSQLQSVPVQQQLQHPGLQVQHPPGTTVRAALKQGNLHLLQQQHQQQQQNNHHMQQLQQQPQQGQLHHAPQHQQQHRSSPMPSTSTASQPQPLLQLSLPVQQQQQQQRPMRMDDSQFRPNPQQTARRMEEKRQGRQRRLQNAFDIMSAQLLTPETEVPFAGVDDVFRRLMPYHLLYEHDMDPNLEEEFDLQFARAMVDADEKRRVITDRMRRIAFNEAMARKDEELNLLLYLDAEWERGRLEEERKMAKEDPESLRPLVRATALSLMDHREEKPPTEKMKALVKPEGAIPLSSSLYEYHPFVERRRIPTPPPPGPLHGLEESEVEEDTEDEKEQCAAAAAGPSSSSFPAKQPALKRPEASDEDDDEDLDEASPEMGWQGTADDLPQRRPPTTVPSRPTAAASSNHSSHHRPATVPERVVVKQDVASPRPAAAAAGKVQPAQPLRVESPARTKITVAAGRSTVGQKHDMPEAIPVPLAKRNRMAEERQKEEERRKKVEEREREAAEKRRKGEEERKERERRGREEERQREREKEERRKREEAVEEQRRVIMPLKIKLKPLPCPREEEKKEEEKRDEEERENREKKSKKKRKKEKRRAEEGDEDEERERKRRKKEKKERERQAAAAAAAAEVVVPPPAAASTMTTPAIPKLKIKYGGAVTPAATPAAASASTPRQPAAPLAAAPTVPPLLLSVAPPTTPVQPLQQQQQPSPAPPSSGLKLKIKLGPPTTAPSPSPAKEERKREKKEKRRENGHHREKDRDKHHHHHHKRKEHSHKEHRKSESRHHEQQPAAAPPAAPAAPPKQPAAASQPPPPVPSVKISIAPPRLTPAPSHPQPPPMVPPPAAVPSMQQLQQLQQDMLQQQMAMNSHFHLPSVPSLFRPSVIAAPPQLQPTMQLLQQSQLLQQQFGLPQPVLPQLPMLPVMPAVPRPVLPPGMVGLPPGFPRERSPEPVAFSDSEGEDDERSNALTKSAADITRMVVPSLLHRLPQLQQVPPSFNRNNQYP